MGIRALTLYVKTLRTVIETREKVKDWWIGRNSIGMEIDCPGQDLYPVLFSQNYPNGKCPYGEMEGE